MNQSPSQSAAGQDWVATYEQLRWDVLSRAAGGSFGLMLFLRQGMIAWMHACTLNPVSAPSERYAQRCGAVSSLPGDVRSQAVLILAGILLHHPTEATQCKVTSTR